MTGEAASGPLLEVRGLETRITTADGVLQAASDVGFHVESGETLAVVGESGCGKSVTMLSLLQLLPSPPVKVSAKSVRFAGQDLSRLRRHEMRTLVGREIGVVFQDPMTSLNPVMTVGHQIVEGAREHLGLSGEKARERAIELLKLVGIPAAADRLGNYPHQFSGGMRQRVMIAMALACRPKLLIADEPTTGLDVTIQAQILRLVKDLRAKLGMAMIWITHDLSVVAQLADRIAVMYAGRIVEEAPTGAFYEAPLHPYSRGLLASLPGIGSQPRGRLTSIGGQPPSLLETPRGCAFAPRCPLAIERCRDERPPLAEVAPQRRTACWRWQDLLQERELSHAS